MNGTFTKKERFLAAERDGKFFSFDPGTHTCSFSWIENPTQVFTKVPYTGATIHEPPYYFENSARMRGWLEGSKMIVVESESTTIFQTFEEGPVHPVSELSKYMKENPDATPEDALYYFWEEQDRKLYLANSK